MVERIRVVDDLVADPWYQLSTAGQELFHTNMLYWLAVQRPEHSRPLWDLFGVDAPVGGVDPRGPIRREWQHIDLYIDSGMPGRKLVLENKVLAIATIDQLERYRARLINLKGFVDAATSYVLLSLLPPILALPRPWHAVGYDELVPALESTAGALDGDERVLVTRYADLVRRLVALRDVYDPFNAIDDAVRLPDGEEVVLSEGRLLSLVRKLQMARIAAAVTAQLAEGGAPAATAGLSNTQGVVSWFMPGPAGRQFGWQVQGPAFRLVALASSRDPKAREARERVIETDHLDYFDFALPSTLKDRLVPYAGRHRWLGYEPDFVYRYQTFAPDLTWRQLIELGVWFSRRAIKYIEGQR